MQLSIRDLPEIRRPVRVLVLLMFGFWLTGPVIAADACRSDCPCDQETVQISKHGDSHPSESDPCPEDCNDCHCCPGIPACALPAGIAFALEDIEVCPQNELPESTLTGAPDNVFRPPR